MYLYLEDGVPTRATGFFNHNALYEVNLPQAGGIEVLERRLSDKHHDQCTDIGGQAFVAPGSARQGPRWRTAFTVRPEARRCAFRP